MQLIRPGVAMLDPIKQKPIGPAEVMEKWGVAPDKLVEVQALMGDAVDNVPGVPGIGPKTAAQLIGEFGDLEAVLAAAPAMKPSKRRDTLIAHAEAARLSRQLVQLRDDAPLPVPLAELARARARPRRGWPPGCSAQGFRSTLLRLGLEEPGAAPAPVPPAAPGSQGALAFAEPPARPTPLPDPAPGEATAPTPPSPPLEALQAWVAEATAAGVGRARHRNRRARRHARQTRRLLARHRAGPRLLRAARATPIAAGNAPEQVPAEQAIAALAPLLADPTVLKVFLNAKFDLLDPGPRRRPAGRAAGRRHADLLRAGRRRATATAWTNWRCCISATCLHQLRRGHRHRAAAGCRSARCRSIAPPPMPPRTPTSRCGSGSTLRPALRTTGALALYEQLERRLDPGAAATWSAPASRWTPTTCARMSRDFEARMAVMEQDIHRLAGFPFNVGSPKQLGEVLFDRMELARRQAHEDRRLGHRFHRCCRALADQGHELPARVLEWRQLQKLKSHLRRRAGHQINPATGRVHTSFAMAIASDRPAVLDRPQPAEHPHPHRGRQPHPPRLHRRAGPRAGFAPTTRRSSCGCWPMSPTSPQLKESFAAGEDIHARTASEVFGVPMAGHGPDDPPARQGDQFRHHLRHLRLRPGPPVAASRRARRVPISTPISPRYPGIRAYMEKTKEEARSRGFVTTPFGRRCWVPGIDDRNPARRGYAERQAINAPLQGGAADIIKRAMVRLPAALARGRPRRADAAAGARRTAVRGARRTRRRRPPRVAREVMESAASAVGAAGGRNRHRPHLGGGALTA